MNGYQMHIDAYKQVLESDRTDIDREYIEAQIKSLQPFAERTEEERIAMFNSGAFNDVLKSYCRVALQNCDIDSETVGRVMEEIRWLLDTVSANEILQK